MTGYYTYRGICIFCRGGENVITVSMKVLLLVGLILFINYIRKTTILLKVRHFESLENVEPDFLILDIRDYHVAFHTPVDGALNIPYAYLHRNVSQIPKKKLIVIAPNKRTLREGIHLLKKNGFSVIGFFCPKERSTLGENVACV